MKIKWIDVKTGYPKHMEKVLARNIRDTYCVVICVSNEEIFRTLMMQNIQVPHEQREGHSFCSQELPHGATFNDVTHWAYIPKVII